MNNLFNITMIQKSNLVRKAIAYANNLPKIVERRFATDADYLARPPIIINSLPKSGTHLLLQVARALPGTRYRGGFIATTPSLTLRERTPSQIAKRIHALLPGEVVGAHIYYSSAAIEAMRSVNAIHLFIYRDPRDVLLSGAHYLSGMNRWHRMHRVFSSISDFNARLRLAIEGYDERYPSCEARISPYLGWVEEPTTLAIKYEDLVGSACDSILKQIANNFLSRQMLHDNTIDLVPTLRSSINPEKSHTFRSGGTEKWRKEYSEENIAAANSRLAAILTQLGYPLE